MKKKNNNYQKILVKLLQIKIIKIFQDYYKQKYANDKNNLTIELKKLDYIFNNKSDPNMK